MDLKKDVWRFLVVNMETAADNIKGSVDPNNLELFHKFLHGYPDISASNIYATKDYILLSQPSYFDPR